MDVNAWQIVAILAAGLAAGFINTLAGGGSFLTLAALDFAGLPITVANGTNRIAVEAGAIMSTLGFHSKGVKDWRKALVFGIPGLFGSVIGAYIASILPGDVFEKIVGVAMIVMLVTMLFDPKRWVKDQPVEITPKRRFWIYVVFFLIGIYGGAIQAGIGFMLTAALVLLAGENLVRTAYFKSLVVGIYTIFALLTFALQGHVNWILGLVLSLGQGLGAWIASRLAVAKGERLIRVALMVMLAVLSVRYLGIIPGF